jgi:hypothetical protein
LLTCCPGGKRENQSRKAGSPESHPRFSISTSRSRVC